MMAEVASAPSQHIFGEPRVIMAEVASAPSQQMFEEPQIVYATATVVGVQGTGQPVAHVNNEVNIVLGGHKTEELRTARMKVPDVLAARGVNENEWKTVCDKIDETARLHFFYSCPTCECIYWCVPLGPIQTCLCLCNPVTWCCCIWPAETANKQATSQINDILGKYGIVTKVEDTLTDNTIATFTSFQIK
eukprot:TRINITY_DN8077_c0_g1_i1.p1 TRINITY_DN8077_c0_g1~~TRINITY_DN8077_c0_g1_i1.p1  ORF type:complete len:191 (-),score=25.54 TRINITY_DN8077_c0_g1_i1:193-765(-)